VITALCSLLHGPLSKQSSEAFASVKSIVQLITSGGNSSITEGIAQLFLERFKPARLQPQGQLPMTLEAFELQASQLVSKIDKLPHPSSRVVLLKMVDAVKSILRTNFYNEDRYALSFRVHPSIMAVGGIGQSESKPLPFGVLFSREAFQWISL